MNKKQTANQNAAVIIIVGILLASIGAYQIYNPVLSVEPHPDRPDLPPAQPRSMLATTTFEVTADCPMPTVTFPDSPEVTFDGATATCRVTLNTQDGNAPKDIYGGSAMMAWDGEDFVDLTDQIDWTAPVQTVTLTWEMVSTTVYAHAFVFLVNSCGAGDNVAHQTEYYSYTISSGAQIDDATDTVTLDKSSYSPGDAIHMTATGTNIGDEMWYGTVNFKTTDPHGTVVNDATKISIAVPAGMSNPVPHVYSLPSTAIAGTWTIQTTWIDTDGVVHARATIDLDPVEIWGLEINVLGGLMVLIGLLVAVYGFTKRKS